jgi:hypothetical protein
MEKTLAAEAAVLQHPNNPFPSNIPNVAPLDATPIGSSNMNDGSWLVSAGLVMVAMFVIFKIMHKVLRYFSE